VRGVGAPGQQKEDLLRVARCRFTPTPATGPARPVCSPTGSAPVLRVGRQVLAADVLRAARIQQSGLALFLVVHFDSDAAAGVDASIRRRATVSAFAENRLEPDRASVAPAGAPQDWFQRGAARCGVAHPRPHRSRRWRGCFARRPVARPGSRSIGSPRPAGVLPHCDDWGNRRPALLR